MAKSLAVAVLPGVLMLQTAAGAADWAVWTRQDVQPGLVSVAPVGSLPPPWRVDSIWSANRKGAWKKACWLSRNGDIRGRRYISPEMMNGSVICDTNCNCRF